MAVFQIRGAPITINEGNASPEQIEQLTRSLGLLPVAHLSRLPQITVRNYADGYRGGGSRSPDLPGGGFIRLSELCFTSRWNLGLYNQTLLHEVGHIIDWAYHCISYLRRHERTKYEALLAHPHTGRTHGPGEHYADAYKDYFIGRIDAVRQAAILSSPAFSGIVVAR